MASVVSKGLVSSSAGFTASFASTMMVSMGWNLHEHGNHSFAEATGKEAGAGGKVVTSFCEKALSQPLYWRTNFCKATQPLLVIESGIFSRLSPAPFVVQGKLTVIKPENVGPALATKNHGHIELLQSSASLLEEELVNHIPRRHNGHGAKPLCEHELPPPQAGAQQRDANIQA